MWQKNIHSISGYLGEEVKFNSRVKTKTEWNKIQIKFMQAHNYHTQFALKNRQSHKEKRIDELIILVGKPTKYDFFYWLILELICILENKIIFRHKNRDEIERRK